jgi:GT2 family glycosyltransferase
VSTVADILRAALLAIAAAFALGGDGSAALKAALVLVPALASRLVRTPPGFDLAFTVALLVEALGTGLGVYDKIGWPDIGSHLVIPLLAAPVVYQAVARLGAVPPAAGGGLRQGVGAGVVTAAGVIALGAVWELVEWGADAVFGTDYSQGYTDTLTDLLADTIAAIAGAALIVAWLSRRREPGPPTASVVIPTYRRRDRIERVVRAALADEAAREVVVVVDGCDDGTFELLTDIARTEPRLKPIWQENAGQLAALQRGVEESRHPVVVMLDDDVVAEPGLIARHAKRHAGARRQVVIGYMPVEEPCAWPERVTARLYSMGYEDQCRRWEADPSAVIGLLWAGNMSMRRDDALEAGLDDLPVRLDYLQDRELGLRLMKSGFTAVFDRSLRATHLYSRTLGELRRDAERSGRGRCALHDVHRDVVGGEPVNPFEDGAWAPRLVLELGRGPAGPALAAVLAGVGHGLGKLGATHTSARYYGLLWGVLEQRAYAAERRRRKARS